MDYQYKIKKYEHKYKNTINEEKKNIYFQKMKYYKLMFGGEGQFGFGSPEVGNIVCLSNDTFVLIRDKRKIPNTFSYEYLTEDINSHNIQIYKINDLMPCSKQIPQPSEPSQLSQQSQEILQQWQQQQQQEQQQQQQEQSRQRIFNNIMMVILNNIPNDIDLKAFFKLPFIYLSRKSIPNDLYHITICIDTIDNFFGRIHVTYRETYKDNGGNSISKDLKSNLQFNKKAFYDAVLYNGSDNFIEWDGSVFGDYAFEYRSGNFSEYYYETVFYLINHFSILLVNGFWKYLPSEQNFADLFNLGLRFEEHNMNMNM
jgi:hypothetical protein